MHRHAVGPPGRMSSTQCAPLVAEVGAESVQTKTIDGTKRRGWGATFGFATVILLAIIEGRKKFIGLE